MVIRRSAVFLALVVLNGLSVAPGAANQTARRSATEIRFPDINRLWGPEDYLKVDAILRSSPPWAFPRLQSANTGPVFHKMIDAGNVAAAQDRSVPVLRRLIDLRCYDGFIGSYRARYNIEVRRGAQLQQELVRLQEFLLDLSALTVDLTEPFAASLDPPVRQALSDMHFFDTYATLKNHLLGVVRSLSETDVYTVPQRTQLAEAIRRHIPVLRSTLNRNDQRALVAELSRLSAQTSDPALRQTLASTALIVMAGP